MNQLTDEELLKPCDREKEIYKRYGIDLEAVGGLLRFRESLYRF